MHELQKLKRLIDKEEWYYQAANFVTLTGSFPMAACTSLKLGTRIIPVRFNLVGYIEGHFVRWWFTRSSMRKVADHFMKLEIEHKPALNSSYEKWKKLAKELARLCKAQSQQNLSNLSNVELVEEWKKFCSLYLSYWQAAIFVDAFDCEGDRILRTACKKDRSKITKEDIAILTTPKQASSLQLERFELLELTEQALRSQKLLYKVKHYSINKLKKSEPKFYNKLRNHADEYFWIAGDYVFTPKLNSSYFLKRIRHLLIHKKAWAKNVLSI